MIDWLIDVGLTTLSLIVACVVVGAVFAWLDRRSSAANKPDIELMKLEMGWLKDDIKFWRDYHMHRFQDCTELSQRVDQLEQKKKGKQ